MPAQHVNLVDHIDLEPTTGRRESGLLQELLNLAHATIRGRVNLDVIHKASSIDLLTAAAMTAGLRHHTGLAVKGLGENAGQGGLAHAPSAGEQIGMVQSFAGQRMLKGLDHMVLTHHGCELSGAPLAREHHRGLGTGRVGCAG